MVSNVLQTMQIVLAGEGIPSEKIEVLDSELQFLNTDMAFKDPSLISKILVELEDKVIPLFDSEPNYDILAKFYHDFLTYAGITNVKNGIVLTPAHICKLFAELIDISPDDVFLDPACGTGSFLITAMDRLTQRIKESTGGGRETQERLKKVKESQLIGFETNSTMYALSISNMLFRGDGKSKIFNADFFGADADRELEAMKPTIGFVNPPYGGQGNDAKPTKKEIQFLERMLDNCSRYGIIIAPWSTFIKDSGVRERILTKHRLVYSINMPINLFQPNASACTTICVFKTHQPHDSSFRTKFVNLPDDGFVLTKKKGRVDLFGKWSNEIEPDLLGHLRNGSGLLSGVSVPATIDGGDEWLVQNHLSADFDALDDFDFARTVKEFAVFLARRQKGVLGASLADSEWIDLVQGFIDPESLSGQESLPLETHRWEDFSLCDPRDENSLFRVSGTKHKYTKSGIHALGRGDVLWVTTSNKNNGVADTCGADEYESDVLTVDSATDGKAFYQPFEFVGSDHVEVLRPTEMTTLNALTGLFLVTLLDASMDRYGYGRKRAQKRLRHESVRLPVTSDGFPDWDWIEDYIRSLPYSSCLDEWDDR